MADPPRHPNLPSAVLQPEYQASDQPSSPASRPPLWSVNQYSPAYFMQFPHLREQYVQLALWHLRMRHPELWALALKHLRLPYLREVILQNAEKMTKICQEQAFVWALKALSQPLPLVNVTQTEEQVLRESAPVDVSPESCYIFSPHSNRTSGSPSNCLIEFAPEHFRQCHYGSFQPFTEQQYEPCSASSAYSTPARPFEPTAMRSYEPTPMHSNEQTAMHSYEPTVTRSYQPMEAGSYEQTAMHSYEPTVTRSYQPMEAGSYEQTAMHSYEPTVTRSYRPMEGGSYEQTAMRLHEPSAADSFERTALDSYKQTASHSYEPTVPGSYESSAAHSVEPTRAHYIESTTDRFFEPTTDSSYEHAGRSISGSKMLKRDSSNEIYANRAGIGPLEPHLTRSYEPSFPRPLTSSARTSKRSPVPSLQSATTLRYEPYPVRGLGYANASTFYPATTSSFDSSTSSASSQITARDFKPSATRSYESPATLSIRSNSALMNETSLVRPSESNSAFVFKPPATRSSQRSTLRSVKLPGRRSYGPPPAHSPMSWPIPDHIPMPSPACQPKTLLIPTNVPMPKPPLAPKCLLTPKPPQTRRRPPMPMPFQTPKPPPTLMPPPTPMSPPMPKPTASPKPPQSLMPLPLLSPVHSQAHAPDYSSRYMPVLPTVPMAVPHFEYMHLSSPENIPLPRKRKLKTCPLCRSRTHRSSLECPLLTENEQDRNKHGKN